MQAVNNGEVVLDVTSFWPFSSKEQSSMPLVITGDEENLLVQEDCSPNWPFGNDEINGEEKVEPVAKFDVDEALLEQVAKFSKQSGKDYNEIIKDALTTYMRNNVITGS